MMKEVISRSPREINLAKVLSKISVVFGKQPRLQILEFIEKFLLRFGDVKEIKTNLSNDEFKIDNIYVVIDENNTVLEDFTNLFILAQALEDACRNNGYVYKISLLEKVPKKKYFQKVKQLKMLGKRMNVYMIGKYLPESIIIRAKDKDIALFRVYWKDLIITKPLSKDIQDKLELLEKAE